MPGSRRVVESGLYSRPAGAVAHYAKLGISIERVMTDNGSCYRSKNFRVACKSPGPRQLLTRPYTPRSNGKAERFIKTNCANGPRLAPTTTRSTIGRDDPLAPSLQLASAAWYLESQHPNQSPRSYRGQPVEAPS